MGKGGTEGMEKADDISAEVDDFKEALENHVEGCDFLKVKTEPGEFEALPLHVQFKLFNIPTLDFILQDFLGPFP